MDRDRSYTARVDDLIVYPFKYGQRIYRVRSIQLGASGVEGFVELEPLGMERPHVYEHGSINAYVPAIIFDKIVRLGVLECVWRRSQNPENSP